MSTSKIFFFFFSSRRRHTRLTCDWSSDVCSSDLPELEAVAPGRELRERADETLVVSPEVGRQLPEHRPKLGRADQRLDPLVEPAHAGVQVEQALEVGDVATHLDREQESRRARADPVCDHVALRQPVEGRVHLDRLELARVVVEPEPRRAPRWIEDAVPPVLVVPARTADSDRLQLSAANSFRHSSGVPAATTRERPSVSSGAWPNGGASGRSIASPHSRTSSCAAAMSTERAPFREQTASTRPAARWQSESASEPMIRSRCASPTICAAFSATDEVKVASNDRISISSFGRTAPSRSVPRNAPLPCSAVHSSPVPKS